MTATVLARLDRVLELLRVCALGQIAAELPHDGLWATNVGRERARRKLETVPLTGSATDCLGLRGW
ncbi:hypothetical protein C7C45_17605 [Micromonospora arborensis]|uniref:Uncharacterized protein n=1 Tax=Micromonospora arborensis TaxID=2116518 RepID=A0A318NH82_9ACTN|nr:hypothetical protein [Micromonospora arborensis]PYC68798.1 hypothetical protein C7C45_17605 [Micromonospora arborensis]